MEVLACKPPHSEVLIFAAAARQRQDGRVDAVPYALVAALIIALIYGTVKIVSRYSNMSEEEYEAEARRASGRGHLTGLLHKIFDPSHRVECVQEQATRARAEENHSGDKPKAGR